MAGDPPSEGEPSRSCRRVQADTCPPTSTQPQSAHARAPSLLLALEQTPASGQTRQMQWPAVWPRLHCAGVREKGGGTSQISEPARV